MSQIANTTFLTVKLYLPAEIETFFGLSMHKNVQKQFPVDQHWVACWACWFYLSMEVALNPLYLCFVKKVRPKISAASSHPLGLFPNSPEKNGPVEEDEIEVMFNPIKHKLGL